MNIRKEKILSIMLVSLLLLSFSPFLTPTALASPAVTRIYPDSPIDLGDVTGTDVVGDEFSVAVAVEDIAGAYGGDVIIKWNTTYFDYVSHNFTMPWNGSTLHDTGPSPYLGFLYSPGFPVDDTVDTGAGTYSAAYASSGDNSFTGDGTMCSVKLKVKKQPESYEIGLGNYIEFPLEITYHKIVDKSAAEITPPTQDGIIHLYSRIFTYPEVPMVKVMPEFIDGSGIGTLHTVNVWLMAADGGDLDEFWDPGGFEIQLNFDPTLLAGVSVTIDPTSWVAGFWPYVLEIEADIDNTEGFVFVAFAGYGETHTPISGKGILFRVVFEEIYEATTYPPPCCDLTLQVPTEHDEWFHLHADAGMINLELPDETDWHAVDALHYMIPYHINDWTDVDGDGELSEGDELDITDVDTGKWRDYTLETLTGTLEVTQEELNVTQTILACRAPKNFTLSMPNNGINYAHVYMANGTDRDLDPSEYIGYPNKIGVLVNLGSYIEENYIVGVQMPLEGDFGLGRRVDSGGIVFMEANNGTHVWNLTGYEYGAWEDAGYPYCDYIWWYCDAWALYLGPYGPMEYLARGDTIRVGYYAHATLAVNYKTVESDPDRIVEYDGEYADFLASLGDPVCSGYDEIYPKSWRSPYHVIGWIDVDHDGYVSVGDKLVMEYTRTGDIGRYVVTGIATDMVVARQYCICDKDVGDEFYCNKICTKIAGVPHSERPMCPWHNAEYSVLLPHVCENGEYCASMAAITGIDVYLCNYPDGFNGKGLMRPGDMFWPQKEVCLCAFVYYNEWPEQNKDVAFIIIDPYGDTYAVLYGRTNEVGIAMVCFRMPWMCDDPEYYIGEWCVIGEVDVACTCYNDTLCFKYDYLVNIWKVTTDKEEYGHCEDIVITVEYGTYAMQEYNVTFTVTVLDDSGVPFGYIEVTLTVGGARYCEYKNGTFIVNLHVVKWARAGFATIHVGGLDWRNNPVGPLATETVYIKPEWAI